MSPDSELCLCFHVTLRKVVNYLRVEKPRRVGQLADCFGAGTGCGWCRPFLKQLFDQAAAGGQLDPNVPTPEEYAKLRAGYIRRAEARRRRGQLRFRRRARERVKDLNRRKQR